MISALRAVALARPVASAISVRVSWGPASWNAVRTVRPRARDSTKSRPSSCFEAPVHDARPEGGAEDCGGGASRRRRSIVATAFLRRGSSALLKAVAVWRLVWLTTLATQAIRSPSGERTGADSATRPGSINWSSSDQPSSRARSTRCLNSSSPPCPCLGGTDEKPRSSGSRARRSRHALHSSSVHSVANRGPGAVRSAGSRSPMRKLRDMARRRVAWWMKRMPSPSGTASETDSSSSSASSSAREARRAGRRRDARYALPSSIRRGVTTASRPSRRTYPMRESVDVIRSTVERARPVARSRPLGLILPPAAVSSRSTATPRISGATASGGTASPWAVGVVGTGISSPVRRSRSPTVMPGSRGAG